MYRLSWNARVETRKLCLTGARWRGGTLGNNTFPELRFNCIVMPCPYPDNNIYRVTPLQRYTYRTPALSFLGSYVPLPEDWTPTLDLCLYVYFNVSGERRWPQGNIGRGGQPPWENNSGLKRSVASGMLWV